MSDTFLSRNIGSVYAGAGTPKLKDGPYAVGEAGIYPGYHCVVTSGRWMLGNQADNRVGAIISEFTNITMDLDTALTYSATLSLCSVAEGYACHGGDRVWAFYGSQSPAVNLVKGDQMDQSATEGLLAKFAYANATDHTDTAIECVGHLWDDAVTGSVSANQLIQIVLN